MSERKYSVASVWCWFVGQSIGFAISAVVLCFGICATFWHFGPNAWFNQKTRRKTTPEVIAAQRHLIIQRGRDIVHRYRDAGSPEPFRKFVAGERQYLDIQPYLGDDYYISANNRANLPDTSFTRDYESGMLLKELARLEQEWGI